MLMLVHLYIIPKQDGAYDMIGGLRNVSCIQTLLPNMTIYFSGMRTSALRILILDGKHNLT